jgi:hypothetical protein
MIGATMNMFEVTTLGQPLEVLKTQMAANRSQTMGQAFRNVWARGGVSGFYQGLIPWVSSPKPNIMCELTSRHGLKLQPRELSLSSLRPKLKSTQSRALVSVPLPLVCWEVLVEVSLRHTPLWVSSKFLSQTVS